jgi:DNA-binding GntR family transcriptional regulator
VKIAKVYKTGNVVLDDGGSQQYRPWSDGVARSTNTSSRFHREVIRLTTPELLAAAAEKLARAKSLALARDLSDMLRRLDGETVITHIDAIRALCAALKGTK